MLATHALNYCVEVREVIKVHSTTKCGMHKSKKLNYFEHSSTFEICKQPGIDIKSSHTISRIFPPILKLAWKLCQISLD